MKIYLVIGAFGDGGITTAMFNRAAMFNDAGHDCTILHLDYKPDFETYISDLHAHGRLRSDIPVLNPFVELMKTATRGGPTLRTEAVAAYRAGPVGEGAVQYFAPDHRLLKTAIFDSELRLRTLVTYAAKEDDFSRAEFAISGWKERESIHKDGVLLNERYFTPDGETYLIRSMHAKTGAQKLIQTCTAQMKGYKSFKNNTAWHTAWFEQLAESHQGKSVFICDGPGSAAKVINMRDGVAGKIVVLHNIHFDGLEFKPGQPFRESSSFLKRIDSFDALVVLTEDQGRDVALDIGDKDKIFIIPNAVQALPAPTVRREPLRVSTFGKLIARKGTDDAIRAFELVLKRLPSATLNIFGMGPQRKALQKLSDSLGISQSVKFHGYTHAANVEMARASVVAFPSKAEAWGLTIAESMLLETPVVAYDCKYGPSDIVEDSVDGYLVPLGDVAGLAERLIHVLEHPAQAQKMGEAGRKKIEALYTREPLMKRWEQMFAAILREIA